MVALINSNVKDFSKHPQLLDVHVARIKMARAKATTYMAETPLLNFGLIMQNNFIPDHSSEKILREIEVVGVGDAKRRDSIVSLQNYNHASKDCSYRIWEALRTIYNHLIPEIASKFWANLYMQHIMNTPIDNDQQKVFHSDTFFPAVKFWYFPHSVMKDNGCFRYVPYSPVLTEALLDWHTRQVEKIKRNDVEAWRGNGHREGSLRISLEEIADLGLAPIDVEVEPNTLLIANVFGFHARGPTVEPCHRYSLHGSIRIDRPI